jgi:hypothetical protein
MEILPEVVVQRSTSRGNTGQYNNVNSIKFYYILALVKVQLSSQDLLSYRL